MARLKTPVFIVKALSIALCWQAFLSYASAEPIPQTLSRASSRIVFGVTSPNPTLQLNGSLRDFSGSFALDTTNMARSKLELSLSLSSAQLPPEQILQAVFLQSVIAKIGDRANTFRSSHLEHIRDSTYLVHGDYTFMNKRRTAALPVQILSATPSRTEIRLSLAGPLTNSSQSREFPEVVESAQGSRGWTKAVLVFTPPKRS